jgi:DNA-binding response OmpR family regulator
MTNAEATAASGLQVVDVTTKPVFSTDYSVQEEPLHILHVDDDASLLSVSKMILETENKFEIDNVTSVDEAFSKLKTCCYDAVVSDYEMPLKNGLDFLKELREQRNNIAFIIFTGRGREEVAVKALNLGADRYIDKNGSPQTVYCELADAIHKVVERKKAKSLLVESEAKYRMLVEESLQGIMIAQGLPPRIIFANSAMGRMLGYEVE